MGQDDGASAGSNGGFDQSGLDVVGRDISVDEDGNQSVLQQRVHRGRKPGSASDHLVPGPHRAIAEARRAQRGDGQQVCRRPGIAGQHEPTADKGGELRLESGVVAPCGKPKVQRGVDKVLQLWLAHDLTGDGNRRTAGHERLGNMR